MPDRRSKAEPRICFLAADSPVAQRARLRLEKRYGACDPRRAKVVVALGGDGFMLETLHRFLSRGMPIFGMNCGTVGFMMNRYAEAGLPAPVKVAAAT